MKTLLKKAPKYLLVVLILVGCAYVLKPGFAQYVEHRNEIKRLEAEIKKLEAERIKLKAQMRALEEENPEYIERLAREKLHLSKPDETIFRFKKKQ
ncbi:septum formation initiator family protein [Candidatus Poribacteria bacterium]|nr:septum formation initiator family protein [Candidatus Poribacteria bacterium]